MTENEDIIMKEDMILSNESLEFLIEDLIKEGALEFVKKEDGLYIPYMMNDSTEYFIRLESPKVIGRLPQKEDTINKYKKLEPDCYTEKNEDKTVNILSLSDGYKGVCGIQYTKAYSSFTLYQYHESGHYWMKDYPMLRRLVYQIGLIYDKCDYLSETACNRTELNIKDLIEFAPFRYYSPISESLDEWYHDDIEGAKTMLAIANEAKDKKLQMLIKIYVKFKTNFLKRKISKYLISARGFYILQIIDKKIEKASQPYNKRVYCKKTEKTIKEKRAQIIKKLEKSGYEGSYPYFQKGQVYVKVTTEQPFTILDWEEISYHFNLEITKLDGKKQIQSVEQKI